MVVGLATAAIQMGMALPTGFLFGVGYGTGVRIGYEQVYPLLFPKGARSTTSELQATMKGMNTVYDAIGGKDASRMGIAVGITNAGEILNNPDFQVLEKLESSSSGLTSLNLSQTPSEGTRSSLEQEASFSSIPQKDSIFFNQPQTSLDDKQFLINEINKITSIQELMRRRNSYTDLNLIQVIEARIRELRNPTQPQPKIVNTVPTTPSAPRRDATALEQEYNQWAAKLHLLQANYDDNKRWVIKHTADTNPRSVQWAKINLTEMKRIASLIRTMSNDYRSPNNTIRKHALRLRQEIANGNWK